MVLQVEVGPPAMAANTSDARVDPMRPRLSPLETALQALSSSDEHKRQQRIERMSVDARHKALCSQLEQTQEALAAAQASKSSLCEELGALRQAREDQGKQLTRYKTDLQAAHELRAVMITKMEDLETSAWTAKQQYIRSLASRIKTSALVLQQLNVTSGTLFSASGAGKGTKEEQVQSAKRKRVEQERDDDAGGDDGDGQGRRPKLTGSATKHELWAKHDGKVSEVQGPETTTTPTRHDGGKVERLAALPTKGRSVLHNCDEQCQTHAESATAVVELRTQVTELKSEYSVLDGKYSALVRKHDEVLAERSTAAQDIKAKESTIEELTRTLEQLSRSKPQDVTNDAVSTSDKCKDKEAQDGRLKMLEESLAQMNAYADQLEMVIAQCASCTIKLQNESTQDSVANRAD
ncbi:unnamed protein product [Hyaloperonospora brassicae]|uniref:Uncharacterized protein n=1 Tax=Hyaloperonospora brassicae TaxID=162125 RepID=A0AAV0UB93_HYABA|nr:unnamed protein product [Hyaloperonospora brassicae]